jgi:hypothetical protein
LVAGVNETGVEAVIHSAVSQDCLPLFPSKVFPRSHEEASFDAFRYLIDALHGIGRPVLSWYSLNHSISVAEAHPDWKMEPISGAGLRERRPSDHDHYLCINSPYRELLPAFCRETVRDVGFDGLWFDGAAFAVDGNSLPGCVCGFCRKQFHDDTGRKLPRTVEWESEDFRIWVNWRYERLMGLWRSLLDAVLDVNAEATVCFNNYRRHRQNGAWESGIPLRPLGWDAWYGANELCQHTHLPSTVLFDEHVTNGDIVGRYPLLIAGNTACVSAQQCKQLRAYVEAGGVLFCCRDFGTLDELGRPHAVAPFDDLLGIERRRPGLGTGTLELRD